MKKMLMAVALLCTLALPAFAQTPPAAGPEAGWEKVDGGMMLQPGEVIPATKLVAAAYGFIWLMVCGFVVVTWQRAGRIERELDELRRRIESKQA
jgi:hypothetical protein